MRYKELVSELISERIALKKQSDNIGVKLEAKIIKLLEMHMKK